MLTIKTTSLCATPSANISMTSHPEGFLFITALVTIASISSAFTFLLSSYAPVRAQVKHQWNSSFRNGYWTARLPVQQPSKPQVNTQNQSLQSQHPTSRTSQLNIQTSGQQNPNTSPVMARPMTASGGGNSQIQSSNQPTYSNPNQLNSQSQQLSVNPKQSPISSERERFLATL